MISNLSKVAWAALFVLAWSGSAAGVTRDVYNVSQLYSSAGGANPGDEIVVHPGTYNLTRTLVMNTSNVTLRGSSGDWNDVFLHCGGMNVDAVREGIQLYGQNITIQDLTVGECFHHAIHFQPGSHGPTISNVRTLNAGEHHMKGAKYVHNGVIENCLLEQTYARTNGDPDRPDGYLGGIDLLGSTNWQIRDNVAKNIVGTDSQGYPSGDPGIFLWQDIYDCVIERNVVIGCNKGIGLGNPMYTAGTHAENCTVRNNFVTRGADIGLELCYTQGLDVFNNTIYGSDPNYFRAVHIYDSGSTSVWTEDLDLSYNIIRGQIFRNANGTWTETGNLVGATVGANWFVDPANGDLHLTANATAAIDGALPLPGVVEDIDGLARPVGDYPDVGADEYGSTPSPPGPYLSHEVKYLGDGKFGVTFTVRGNDGQQKSFFVNMTFEGANGGEIQQVLAFGTSSVDSDDLAALYDPVPVANYDMDLDSYFLQPFPDNAMDISEAANSYHIEAGTGGASQYLDVGLAYIVCTGDVSYDGMIFRSTEGYGRADTARMPVPGDADLNDVVDGADYTAWADHYGQTDVGWEEADFNGDDVVDGADYTVWADFYGMTGTSPAPEPATAALMALGLVALLRRRRR